MGFFWRGLVIGFSVAAPVGPIGLLCVRRTLEHGRVAGFVSGLGAATADLFYGSVAAFGLTFVSGFLLGQRGWLKFVGGIFLICLGLRTFFARSADRVTTGNGPKTAAGLAGAYLSSLLLTLTNPLTILSFAAIMAGLGQGGIGSGYGSAIRVMAGVFTGSVLWWLLLSTGVAALGNRLGRPVLLFIQRASGVFLAAFGVAALTWR